MKGEWGIAGQFTFESNSVKIKIIISYLYIRTRTIVDMIIIIRFGEYCKCAVNARAD